VDNHTSDAGAVVNVALIVVAGAVVAAVAAASVSSTTAIWQFSVVCLLTRLLMPGRQTPPSVVKLNLMVAPQSYENKKG